MIAGTADYRRTQVHAKSEHLAMIGLWGQQAINASVMKLAHCGNRATFHRLDLAKSSCNRLIFKENPRHLAMTGISQFDG
ncbi:hypothetical protein MTBLM1_40073 [Rhodospirillaceae bacterium LM-1]|nr:hypothetical protein MTBLM1_40073 [Rhodospirillaceae bacterium LM-1]